MHATHFFFVAKVDLEIFVPSGTLFCLMLSQTSWFNFPSCSSSAAFRHYFFSCPSMAGLYFMTGRSLVFAKPPSMPAPTHAISSREYSHSGKSFLHCVVAFNLGQCEFNLMMPRARIWTRRKIRFFTQLMPWINNSSPT